MITYDLIQPQNHKQTQITCTVLPKVGEIIFYSNNPLEVIRIDHHINENNNTIIIIVEVKDYTE